jgi:hypothetical protein
MTMLPYLLPHYVGVSVLPYAIPFAILSVIVGIALMKKYPETDLSKQISTHLRNKTCQ